MPETPNQKLPLTKDELAEAIEQQKLTAAYREVFGTDEKRNTSQRKVWDDLLEKTLARTSIHSPGRDGKIDPLDAAIRSGRRDIYLHIEKMLHFELDELVKKQEPKQRR